MNVKRVLANAGIKVVNNKVAKADLAKAVQVLMAKSEPSYHTHFEIQTYKGKVYIHTAGEELDITDLLLKAGINATDLEVEVEVTFEYDHGTGVHYNPHTADEPPRDPSIEIRGVDLLFPEKSIDVTDLILANKKVKSQLEEDAAIWYDEKLADDAADHDYHRQHRDD